MRTLGLVLMFAASSAAATCPPAQDISAQLDVLIAAAREAPDESAGQDISRQMWELWLTAPDTSAQEVLERGMRARQNYDFVGAVEAYNHLIAYCPEYAEGYNQRAFIAFLRGDYPAALIDLDEALTLSPNHVGAQSGRALTLMHLGRLSEARKQLGEALENNPWLSERFLLSKGGPLEAVSEDI